MIRFTCSCGRELQTADEPAGRQVRCPTCGQVQTVPGGITTTPVERAESMLPAGQLAFDEDEPEPLDSVATTTSRKAIWSLVLGVPSLVCSVFTGIPAIILGALAVRDIARSRGRLGGNGLAIAGMVTGALGVVLILPMTLIGLLLPAVQKVREAAIRTQSSNNLKQMALAMHNYNDTYGCFPAAAGGAEGRDPMNAGLSWRVTLLPFLDGSTLYRRFKLDEPWDSPNNKALLQQMPRVYASPGIEDPPGMTRYRVFVGPSTPLRMPQKGEPARGSKISDFTNGLSNTILIVEAADAVPWTKPDELVFEPDQPLPRLLFPYGHGANVLMADGSVRLQPQATADADLRAMISIGSGDNKRRK
jgi:prepilin-type processing-associated H-X9-DG protein